MNGSTKVFIAAVLAAGVLTLAVSVEQWRCADPRGFALLVILAAVCSGFKLRIPGLEGTFSANFVFVLIGVAAFSQSQTIALGCIGGLAQMVLRAKRRPTLIQVAFNIANLSVCAQLAYLAPRWISDAFVPLAMPLRFALAAAVYFVANTALVAGVTSRLSGAGFTLTWKRWHLWSFPYYAGGAAIAALLVLSNQPIDWRPCLLMLPAIYLLYKRCEEGVKSSAGQVGTLPHVVAHR